MVLRISHLSKINERVKRKKGKEEEGKRVGGREDKRAKKEEPV